MAGTFRIVMVITDTDNRYPDDNDIVKDVVEKWLPVCFDLKVEFLAITKMEEPKVVEPPMVSKEVH